MEFLLIAAGVYVGSVLKDVTLSFYVAFAQKRSMKKRAGLIAEWEQRLLEQEAREQVEQGDAPTD